MNEPKGLKAWLFTTDHKKIGIMYLVTSMVFLVVGLLLATVMRIGLLSPQNLLGPKLYNVSFTIHGAGLILFWMIPVLTGFFANYLIPLMIGARDVAFPRLNALSYWFFVGAAVVAVMALLLGLDVGWYGYPPYSISEGVNTALYVFVVLLLGLSGSAGAVNFLTTIISMRAPGMKWGRLNLTVWGFFGAFIIQIVALPLLAAAVIFLFFDKYLGTSFYNVATGGNPILYQHLFWFYGHPAVYVVALPVFGIVSEIISTFARKRIFGYTSMVIAIMVICVIGFETWIHHLYTAGVLDWARILFMWATILIAVPTGIKVYNWLGTLHKGSIEFNTPMLHTLGFISLFTIGGVTGVANGLLGFDIHAQDSHWIPAHFHYVLALSMTILCIGGIYYWFPKFTGRMYNEKLGKAAFWITIAGAMFAFAPHFLFGMEGLPRRYANYPPEFHTLQVFASITSFIAILGFVLMIFNLLYSAIKGPKASANPWGAKSLEWQIPSPPPFYNFEKIPTITAGPYEWGRKKEEKSTVPEGA
jgi:cytochrome c oxidase subunit 1